MSKLHQLKASFHIYLGYSHDHFEMEDIHKLRVTIRKLKALYAVLEFSLPAEFSKTDYNNSLKELFGRAGRVRENQINIQQIQTQELKFLNPYLEYQFRALKRNQRLFKSVIGDFDINDFEAQCEIILNQMARFENQWCLEKISFYASNKLSKITILQQESMSDQVLHKIRKQFRTIGDVLSMFNKSDAEQYSAVSVKQIKPINNKLGAWHDELVLTHSLERFLKRHTEMLANKRFHDFFLRSEQKLEVEKKQIISLLSSWQ